MNVRFSVRRSSADAAAGATYGRERSRGLERSADANCILCGTCVDTCPHGVLRYGWGKGRD